MQATCTFHTLFVFINLLGFGLYRLVIFVINWVFCTVNSMDIQYSWDFIQALAKFQFHCSSKMADIGNPQVQFKGKLDCMSECQSIKKGLMKIIVELGFVVCNNTTRTSFFFVHSFCT